MLGLLEYCPSILHFRVVDFPLSEHLVLICIRLLFCKSRLFFSIIIKLSNDHSKYLPSLVLFHLGPVSVRVRAMASPGCLSPGSCTALDCMRPPCSGPCGDELHFVGACLNQQSCVLLPVPSAFSPTLESFSLIPPMWSPLLHIHQCQTLGALPAVFDLLVWYYHHDYYQPRKRHCIWSTIISLYRMPTRKNTKKKSHRYR